MSYTVLKAAPPYLEVGFELPRNPGLAGEAESQADAMRNALAEFLAREGYSLWEQPACELDSDTLARGLCFRARLKVLPLLRLPPLQTLALDVTELEPRASTLTEKLAELHAGQARERELPGPAQPGDILQLDIAAFVKGVPLPGYLFTGRELSLQPEALLPGLAQKLVGLKAGQSKDFVLPLPADYPYLPWRSQPAQFKLQLQAIRRRSYPPLDAAFARAARGAEDLQQLEGLLLAELEAENQRAWIAAIQARLLDELLSRSGLELPEDLIEAKLREVWHGTELPQFQERRLPERLLEQQYQAWKAVSGAEAEVRRNLGEGLVIKALLAQGELSLSQAELDAQLLELCEGFGLSLAEGSQRLSQADLLEDIQAGLLRQKALGYLMEQVQLSYEGAELSWA